MLVWVIFALLWVSWVSIMLVWVSWVVLLLEVISMGLFRLVDVFF